MTQHSSYLKEAISSPSQMARTVSETVKQIRELMAGKKQLQIDAIACCGVSGITIAAPVAIRLKKQLIIVRKQEENSHASFKVEGLIKGKVFSYLIVDDLIESGRTCRNIISNISESNRFGVCVGAFLYNSQKFVDLSKLRL
jgi:adenine/guanine phosphoribosyltransferase-like PRPP-binding protein